MSTPSLSPYFFFPPGASIANSPLLWGKLGVGGGVVVGLMLRFWNAPGAKACQSTPVWINLYKPQTTWLPQGARISFSAAGQVREREQQSSSTQDSKRTSAWQIVFSFCQLLARVIKKRLLRGEGWNGQAPNSALEGDRWLVREMRGRFQMPKTEPPQQCGKPSAFPGDPVHLMLCRWGKQRAKTSSW